MAVVLNFVGTPSFSLLPILVTKRFGGEALQPGSMNSAWGIGVVVGGLALGAWGGFRRRIHTSLLGLVTGGLATLAIGLAPANAFWLALGSMLVAGAMNAITNGPLFAILQGTVAPGMQGRVFTVVASLCALMSPLGLAIAGPVADVAGVSIWFVIDGLSCMLMGIGALFVPVLMHLEENHTPRQAVGVEPRQRKSPLPPPATIPAWTPSQGGISRLTAGWPSASSPRSTPPPPWPRPAPPDDPALEPNPRMSDRHLSYGCI
jgi:MFS family permease